MSKWEKIPGVRLKIRTNECWITATLWMDDKPALEMARLNIDIGDGPGGPLYQAWLAAVEMLLDHYITNIIGATSVSKRARANYQGERHGNGS